MNGRQIQDSKPKWDANVYDRDIKSKLKIHSLDDEDPFDDKGPVGVWRGVRFGSGILIGHIDCMIHDFGRLFNNNNV